MRTRVKICGITRVTDALDAARAGADAIGLVFHPQSPRRVSLEEAHAIVQSLPPFVTPVGLFVDAAPDLVRQVLAAIPLGLLQFHGTEPPEYCRAFGRPYIKAVAMGEGVDVHAQAHHYADAAGLLLDTALPGIPGGTGRSFDWARVPRDLPRPVILAGGLAPENVAEAIRRVRPYAVDVSSGVERAKGLKDAERISAFMREVKQSQ